MLKIIADDKIPFLRKVLEPYSKIIYLPGNVISRQDLYDAEALLIRTRTRCNEQLLQGSKIKFIASATIGYDHIDTDYCNENNILWTNAPGCNSGSVAQYLASVFANFALHDGLDLSELTIGIIGAGNVGSKVARVAETFGMKVLVNDPPRQRKEGNSGFVSLEEITAKANIITFHVPLQKWGPDKTWLLAGPDFFNQLKKKPIVINTSRGEVVDETALKKAYLNGKITKIVLDVWQNEPDIDTELLNMAEVTTPHIAGYSVDGKANGTAMIVNAISRVMNFPLTNWYPDNLPKPGKTGVVEVYASDQEFMSKCVLHTYDVMVDSNKLKLSSGQFEFFRDSYPPRREFLAFTISSENLPENCIRKLKNLNFRIT